MTDTELLRLAWIGALARLEAIDREARSLSRAFPGLRAKGPAPGGKGRLRLMSAAARRAVSVAQKRRWAKWRKARAAKHK